jgi:hypothetical protein
MPAAAARDKLAISVELAGRSEEMEEADIVIGIWGTDDSAHVMKDRYGTYGLGEVNVVNARSIAKALRESDPL